MLWTLLVVLLAFGLLGMGPSAALAGLVHVLLVAVAVILVLQLVDGRRFA